MRILFTIIFLFCLTSLFSQNLENSQYLGGPGFDKGHAILQTNDGGYIITGVTDSSNGSKDITVIRTDQWGLPLWSRGYGTAGWDEGNAIIETYDGNYVVTGFMTDTVNGGWDLAIVKINATGDVLWTKTYGNGGMGFGNMNIGFDIKETSDSGYIVVGLTKNGTVPGKANVFILRTNSIGDTLWTKMYGGSTFSYGQAVEQTADGGFIITGTTAMPGGGILLLKISAIGDSLWARSYGEVSPSVFGGGYDIEIINNSEYLIAGWISLNGARDVFLIKADSTGDTLWTKIIGGNGEDEARSVKQTTDGGFIITGLTNSFGAGDDDVYLIKTDSAGNITWTETYGFVFDDIGESVIQTSDGGLAIVGTSDRGSGDTQVWFMKIGLLSGINAIGNSATLVNVYPNPFTDYTNVRLGTGVIERYSDLRFEILDVIGKKVREISIVNSPEFQLYRKGMSSGLYFYRLNANSQVIESGKIIVQ